MAFAVAQKRASSSCLLIASFSGDRSHFAVGGRPLRRVFDGSVGAVGTAIAGAVGVLGALGAFGVLGLAIHFGAFVWVFFRIVRRLAAASSCGVESRACVTAPDNSGIEVCMSIPLTNSSGCRAAVKGA